MLLSLTLLTCVFTRTFKNDQVWSVIVANDNTVETLHKLEDKQWVDLWTPVSHGKAMFRVPKWRQIVVGNVLKGRGVNWEIVMNDVQAVIDSQKKVSDQSPFNPDSIFDSYQSVETLHEYLDHLHDKYPEYTTLFDIGETYEGNTIRGIKIHDKNVTLGDEQREMVFHGGVHAR
jgi:Zinc carboxypeptidase/Carboxypeptidase activation peptide